MRFTLYYLNSITGVHNGKLSIQKLLKLNPRKNVPIIKTVLKCSKFQEGDITKNNRVIQHQLIKWEKTVTINFSRTLGSSQKFTTRRKLNEDKSGCTVVRKYCGTLNCLPAILQPQSCSAYGVSSLHSWCKLLVQKEVIQTLFSKNCV